MISRREALTGITAVAAAPLFPAEAASAGFANVVYIYDGTHWSAIGADDIARAQALIVNGHWGDF